MDVDALLVDGFERIREILHRILEDVSDEVLTYRPHEDANSIAWLIWHLTRIQDDHLSGVAGTEQIWTAQGWVERYGLPFDPSDTGYGHTSGEVAAVVASATDLLGYHDAVLVNTTRYVRGLTPTDLERIVDPSWDPPVALGVRLVSVISDGLQHAGQAAYVRGLAERR